MASGSGFFSTNDSNISMFPCGLPPYFPPSFNIHPAISYVQVAIALIMGFTGFFLNLFILVMIIKYKRLHNRLMYLAVQITAVDLLYTMAIPPVIFTSGVAGTWLLGMAACNILGMIHDGFVMFRFLMTLILTLDRFVSVFWPFFHLKRFTFPLCVLILIVYLVSIARVIIPLKGILGCYLYVPTLKACTVFSGCSKPCFWLVVTHSIIVLFFGMFLPLLLYVILFCKIKSVTRSRRRRQRTVTTSMLRNITILTSKIATELPMEALHINGPYPQKENARRTASADSIVDNGGISRSRHTSQNTRVNVTMFILLMSVIGSTTPAFTLYFIQFSTLQASPALFIVNMLVGRTFFNFIPIMDSIAIMRLRAFKISVNELIK